MKTLKKQIVIIGLFVTSIWATQPLFATNYTILTHAELENILTEIVDTYGGGQGPGFSTAVRAFLLDQLESNPLPIPQTCPYVQPKVGKAQFGESISFSWGSGLNSDVVSKTYEINNFNMSTWETDGKVTSDNKVTFRPLADGYYIFSFIASCGDKGVKSSPNIVIADKDLLLVDDIIRQNESTDNIASWSISPNPFDQEIAVHMQASKVDRLVVLLYDLNGRIVKSIETMTTIDPQSFFLSTRDLANGFYTLSIQTPTQHLQQKLIKAQ